MKNGDCVAPKTNRKQTASRLFYRCFTERRQSQDVWKMPESAKTSPGAAGEQVDKDLSQKALHSRGEPATEATTASSEWDPLLWVTPGQMGSWKQRKCSSWISWISVSVPTATYKRDPGHPRAGRRSSESLAHCWIFAGWSMTVSISVTRHSVLFPDTSASDLIMFSISVKGSKAQCLGSHLPRVCFVCQTPQ